MISKERKIKNTLIYIVPNVVSGFLPIITLPIFTRILTTSDYGRYALAEIYAIFLSGIVNFGLTASYERNFFQYTDKRKSSELLYSTLAFVLITFMLAIVFTYVLKKPISRIFLGSAEYSFLLFWVFLARVVTSFKQYFLIYFKNTARAKDFTVYTVDEIFLGVTLSLFFVAYLKTGIVGLAWGQFLASMVVLSFLIARFLRVMPFCFGWKVLKDSLKISLPLTPRIFLGVVSAQFTKYIVNILNTLGGVGVLSIAQKIANITFVFMTALQNVFNPHVYQMMFSAKASAGKEIGQYLTVFAYFSVLVCLLFSLFAEEIVRIFTGPSFYTAAPLISILSMFFGFQFFGKINGIQLIYTKKTFLTSILTMMDIGVGIAISIPFIKGFGVIGAAWATFFGGLLSGSVAFIISQHYFRIEWETKKIVIIFSILCASSMLALFIATGAFVYPVGIALKLFCIAIYILFGAKLGIITRQNFKLLWNIATFRKFDAEVNVKAAS